MRKHKCRESDIDARADELSEALGSSFFRWAENPHSSLRAYSFFPVPELPTVQKRLWSPTQRSAMHPVPRSLLLERERSCIWKATASEHEKPDEIQFEVLGIGQDRNDLFGSVEETQATSESGAKVVATVRCYR